MTTSEEHKHYWKPVGQPRMRWNKGHALGRCIRKGCDAWTVLGLGEVAGPCPHVVAMDRAVTTEMMQLEMVQCDGCGAIRENDEEECEWCGKK